MKTTNPQQKAINQKRGPTNGNQGTPEKRHKFMEMKNDTNSEKSQLADMVMAALENRGVGMKPYYDPAVESLHDNTGPSRNPTADGSRLPKKNRRPITKG